MGNEQVMVVVTVDEKICVDVAVYEVEKANRKRSAVATPDAGPESSDAVLPSLMDDSG